MQTQYIVNILTNLPNMAYGELKPKYHNTI